MDKNTQNRTGYKNRHTDGLPNTPVVIEIITKDFEGEHFFLCNWYPFTQEAAQSKFAEGYVGTARVMGKKHQIGFNVWKQNDSEFVYYKEM